MCLTHRRELRRSRASLQTAGTTEVAGSRVVDIRVVHHRDVAVVHVVVHHLRANVVHIGVVVEVVPVPVAALVSKADEAEAIVDAAVIAYVLPPVAAVPSVPAAVMTPPAGRPECAHKRSGNPVAGHIVVPSVRVVPITGCPQIIRARRGWLLIHRQRRRWLLRLWRVGIQQLRVQLIVLCGRTRVIRLLLVVAGLVLRVLTLRILWVRRIVFAGRALLTLIDLTLDPCRRCRGLWVHQAGASRGRNAGLWRHRLHAAGLHILRTGRIRISHVLHGRIGCNVAVHDRRLLPCLVVPATHRRNG